MGTGKLLIQSRIADSALPLSGVQIRIIDHNGTVIYALTTDESGETKQISLEAVDRIYSLDQSYTGIPYSTYELVAEKEGYNSLRIADVQIFDGENAIQPVELIPMLENQLIPSQQELFFGRHAVEMAGPRSQEPSQITPFVMRQVIIPNPITVHLGQPSASASNVQVPFTD